MPAAKKIVKKLALKRETVRSLSVKSGVLTGVENDQSATGWPPSHPWTQSHQSGSAVSGMPNSAADSQADTVLHVKFGLLQSPP